MWQTPFLSCDKNVTKVFKNLLKDIFFQQFFFGMQFLHQFPRKSKKADLNWSASWEAADEDWWCCKVANPLGLVSSLSRGNRQLGYTFRALDSCPKDSASQCIGAHNTHHLEVDFCKYLWGGNWMQHILFGLGRVTSVSSMEFETFVGAHIAK
jgi:hypothetical protein